MKTEVQPSELSDSTPTLSQVESVFSEFEQKLIEVSSATEMATSELLDSLDRALLLVDQLEVGPSSSDDDADPRDDLREELHTLVTVLQFQDIAKQQLGNASTVLEERMLRLAEVFDLSDGTLVDA
jgi:hypothetical protein|uniref:Uncharacterized protein n=1 Tax=uncultured Gemmatimonadales bacterium HF4000_15H13 TaxID=723618 RepID=E7C8A1_9BACT|nr:hypothetical protein [uncultured Gemmatimonadales bacterium HF4000_15H13]